MQQLQFSRVPTLRVRQQAVKKELTGEKKENRLLLPNMMMRCAMNATLASWLAFSFATADAADMLTLNPRPWRQREGPNLVGLRLERRLSGAEHLGWFFLFSFGCRRALT